MSELIFTSRQVRRIRSIQSKMEACSSTVERVLAVVDKGILAHTPGMPEMAASKA